MVLVSERKIAFYNLYDRSSIRLCDIQSQQMSPTSKVTHWFQASSTLPRQESGFVDTDLDEARDLLLSRIPSKKRKRIMRMHKGNVKTF
ncbi:hypothetical protein M8J77_009262 [Diaphorina citri]|nr:hypothetical protein M8J77_009262 [Diaphorina citri]